MSLRIVLAGLAVASLALPASAQYTTVDISSAVNANVAINAYTFPVGTSTGNAGTPIPFAISPYPANSGVAGTWLGSGTGSTVTISGIGASGQASFYALLNNYYGTPGADEYDITIKATNGDTVTYQSIGGVDTRDYNQNVFTNTIANTTFAWFDNGIGQRLDLREFILPASFLGETIDSFTIVQVNDVDQALFSGLTFSTQKIITAVPEPETYALMLFGLAALGAKVRQRRRAAQAC
jgi:PEP-CTERM motif